MWSTSKDVCASLSAHPMHFTSTKSLPTKAAGFTFVSRWGIAAGHTIAGPLRTCFVCDNLIAIGPLEQSGPAGVAAGRDRPRLIGRGGNLDETGYSCARGSRCLRRGDDRREATRAAEEPAMAVMNNLVIYDQHVAQNSLESIVPDLATKWEWSEDAKS